MLLFKNIFRNYKVKLAIEDIEKDTKYLQGGDDEDISLIVGVSTLGRYEMDKTIPLTKILSLGLLNNPNDIEYAQATLSKTLKSLQSDSSFALASGMMVWLHSIRAYRYPEIRFYAREMWKELQRGFGGGEISLIDVGPIADFSVSDIKEFDFTFIPDGLEPKSDKSS